ncbi:bacteriophage abortive infection AbiH family protein [Paenibacillus polysaccharolyticus]|uniref:bacteriophage abortive infection AbiH family protein n=1 Tax=Paenibacillus polysaccharolyticus TaxID=582692 RepID=UPI0020A18047|nr:bacteriophage abortive infection AbiH family protein [Paenibacillus polysaccharolyticus]MCP1134480.1 bacteriophage abortive infection AbiH family protein [Paenibacillus polysaccharolyticus]
MELFVIGNGFDIAHKLETQYFHFREFIKESSWGFLARFEEMYGFYPTSDEELVKEYLWREFEKKLSDIDEEIMIENGVSIELDLESGDIGILDTLNGYWEDEYNFIKKLQSYLYDWIKAVDIDVERKTDLISQDRDDIYLNFNYTLVLEKVYEIESNRIIHIHGSVDEDDIEPVIGHGNQDKINKMKERIEEASNNFWEKEESIYRAVLNYYKRTLKDVESFLFLHQTFFGKLINVQQVHIVGTSLGEVDMPYFHKIKEHVGENTIWNIYYYNVEEIEHLVKQVRSLGVNEENINVLDSSTSFFSL